MLLSKLLLPLLPLLALAAPAAESELEARRSVGDLFKVVDGNVLVGPGGYMQNGVFYPGAYNGIYIPTDSEKDGNDKRELDLHQHEERFFGLTAALLGKLWGGKFGCGGCGGFGRGGGGGRYIWGGGSSGYGWKWGSGGYTPCSVC